jgi:hypothetical protein
MSIPSGKENIGKIEENFGNIYPSFETLQKIVIPKIHQITELFKAMTKVEQDPYYKGASKGLKAQFLEDRKDSFVHQVTDHLEDLHVFRKRPLYHEITETLSTLKRAKSPSENKAALEKCLETAAHLSEFEKYLKELTPKALSKTTVATPQELKERLTAAETIAKCLHTIITTDEAYLSRAEPTNIKPEDVRMIGTPMKHLSSDEIFSALRKLPADVFKNYYNLFNEIQGQFFDSDNNHEDRMESLKEDLEMIKEMEKVVNNYVDALRALEGQEDALKVLNSASLAQLSAVEHKKIRPQRTDKAEGI